MVSKIALLQTSAVGDYWAEGPQQIGVEHSSTAPRDGGEGVYLPFPLMAAPAWVGGREQGQQATSAGALAGSVTAAAAGHEEQDQ